MPYKTNADIPSSVASALPASAQTIWRGAFNGFSKSNPKAKEEAAFKVAWAAVKEKYRKVRNTWVRMEDAMQKQRVNLFDTFMLDGVRRTADGYLAAYANVARTGVQMYKGKELGRPDLGDVKVYRPPAEVFHKDAMHSMAHRPVTLMHPSESVNARNWKKYAMGHTGDEVIRDGDHVRVPMVVMDAAAISAIESNDARELSMGYSTDLKWGKGKTRDGQTYDAVQTAIRANHLAIVPLARGGSTLKLGDQDEEQDTCPKCGMDVDADATECPYCKEDLTQDSISSSAPDDYENDPEALRQIPDDWVKSKTKDAAWSGSTRGDGQMTATVVIDGARIEVADELSANVINKHVSSLHSTAADLKSKLDKSEADKEEAEEEAERQQKDHKTAIDAKDGEIAVLKKQLADAQALNSPEKLDALVKDRLAVTDMASKILPSNFVFDGKSVLDIRKAAVSAKLGDSTVKDMSDAAIEGAFKALTADAARSGPSQLRDAIALSHQRSNGQRGDVDIRDAAHAEMEKNLNNAWRGGQKSA